MFRLSYSVIAFALAIMMLGTARAEDAREKLRITPEFTAVRKAMPPVVTR
jgi:hypothetical protein